MGGFLAFLKTRAKAIGHYAVKRAVPAPIHALIDLVATQPLLRHFSPASQQFINAHGRGVITGIQISRTLISNTMHNLLNLITIGQWNAAREMLNYDKLYHLFMIISYRDERGLQRVILEKNERPQFVQADARGGEIVDVSVGGSLTIFDFVNNAIRRVGASRYFVYDAFNRTAVAGNCQRFVDDNMIASPQVRYNAHIRGFVMQNVQELIRRLPEYTGNVAKMVTDFYSRLRTGLGV